MKSVILAFAVGTCSLASPGTSDTVNSIYWSDGDSGRIDGTDFRLADVDAPETGGVGAAIGGAECEREREQGFEAKAFMVELTKGADLEVTNKQAPDRYGRIVLSLSAGGRDVAAAGLDAGMLRPWPHRGGRALTDKPDWCA
ncbi:MAG: thermonuclease family protein [Henriciella sp.]|uniref:thermonuclease family protein n=1 Tax=Henriciella sp. TaxID=1968823 RepID=UPI003C74CDBF